MDDVTYGKLEEVVMCPVANPKQHAHDLIERMPLKQVSAVVDLLEIMLDPVSRAMANAAVDDEPESESERQAVAASRKWLEEHPAQGISHQEMLAELGGAAEHPENSR